MTEIIVSLFVMLSIMPLGFLGILGGVLGGGLKRGLGGGRRGGGGLLGGLLGNDSGGGKQGSGMKTYNAQAPKSPDDTPEAQEQPQQTKAEVQQAAPEQQPRQEAMVQDTTKDVQQAQPKMQKQETALTGLLDEAKPTATPAEPTKDNPPEPMQIVNRTEEKTPVAPQQDGQVGETPSLERTDLLSNRLFDAGTNRQPFEFQEGMPAKQYETDSEWTPAMGMQYKQPTTVAGSIPARRYRG